MENSKSECKPESRAARFRRVMKEKGFSQQIFWLDDDDKNKLAQFKNRFDEFELTNDEIAAISIAAVTILDDRVLFEVINDIKEKRSKQHQNA